MAATLGRKSWRGAEKTRRAWRTVNRYRWNIPDDRDQLNGSWCDSRRGDEDRRTDRRSCRRVIDHLMDGLGIEMVEDRAGMMLARLVRFQMPMRDLPVVPCIGGHVMDVLLRQHGQKTHARRHDDRKEASETTHRGPL
jgi:hypothetical protein